MAGLRQRPGDQPLPVPNDSPDVQSMVIADIGARRELGISRYGTALQTANGRDALRDLYEELLDSVMYVRQVIAERDDPNLILVRREDLAWALHFMSADGASTQVVKDRLAKAAGVTL
jgi:hypothetical protein